MLANIYIRHLATIEEAELDLHAKTTVITGETGAGKSIFIEAIELALGERSKTDVIRVGKNHAEINLCFDIKNPSPAYDWLKFHDFLKDNECIIRRIITQDGRSKSYINGIPVTLQLVRELSQHLLHLHGQHEQQILLKTEDQRDILDRYAEHLPLLNDIKQLAFSWHQQDKEIKALKEKIATREQHREYLQFQLQDLSSLHLHEGEWEKIEVEHRKLTHLDELLRQIQQALQELSEKENHNILSSLGKVRRSLESIQATESKAKEWLVTLNSVSTQLSDLETELHHYLDSNNFETERVEQIAQRYSQILDCARKYKTEPASLVRLQQQMTLDSQKLDACDQDLIHLKNQQQQTLKQYQTLCQILTQNRQRAAKYLSKTVTQTIRLLSLPHAEFTIQLQTKMASELSTYGQENIQFLMKTNPDQPLSPIVKVISGGELSRLSLALHLALADQAIIPTLVFDEVDTGVSGATAEKIGKLLQKLGKNYQVFCITHLAQVAACGHHHLLVEKKFIKQVTYTHLRWLTTPEKTQEIARMLGGEKITETTLKHAQEVLEGI